MKDYPYSIFNPSELHSSVIRISSIISQELSIDRHATALNAKVAEGIGWLEQAMGKVLSNEYTSSLAEADGKRDRNFTSLRNYIKSFAGDDDATLSGACSNLLAIIEKQGMSLHSYGYVKESAALHALFSEFNLPVNAGYLTALEATSRYQKLVASQAAFEAVSKQKSAADSADVNIPLSKTAKQQIVTYLLPLLSYIDSKALLEPAAYKGIVAKIDAIITEVVSTAHARETRKANQEKEAQKAQTDSSSAKK